MVPHAVVLRESPTSMAALARSCAAIDRPIVGHERCVRPRRGVRMRQRVSSSAARVALILSGLLSLVLGCREISVPTFPGGRRISAPPERDSRSAALSCTAPQGMSGALISRQPSARERSPDRIRATRAADDDTRCLIRTPRRGPTHRSRGRRSVYTIVRMTSQAHDHGCWGTAGVQPRMRDHRDPDEAINDARWHQERRDRADEAD